MGLGANCAGEKENTAHLRTFLHYRGGPADLHEAISGFSGILSYFPFYFLEEIGWSLVIDRSSVTRHVSHSLPISHQGWHKHFNPDKSSVCNTVWNDLEENTCFKHNPIRQGVNKINLPR